ncbi:unnamed protein product [Fusarium venenatum]|uniref:Uncharacterized protein n=1 Tax=Fusarium venenatum TaxID=56646 RepID=A0A2L2SW82_9HYPO|nr:uncharacterized protein FVRRES_05344 [Fusarium venenatum]CEI60908.1 unnamed protein product [Fusarium venenatum]
MTLSLPPHSTPSIYSLLFSSSTLLYSTLLYSTLSIYCLKNKPDQLFRSLSGIGLPIAHHHSSHSSQAFLSA